MRSRVQVGILTAISTLILAGTACDGPLGPTGLWISRVNPNYALIYQPSKIVIHGSGFDRPSIQLGGRAARVTSFTSTQIWVETARFSEPGVVDVVVINFQGGEARLAKALTFVDFGPMGIEAPDGNFAGHPVTVLGAGFLPGARVLFDGADVTVRSTTGSTLVVVPPEGSGTVDVSVINPDGRTGVLSRGFTYGTVTLAVSPTSVSAGGPLIVSWEGPRWFCDCGDSDRLGLFRIGDPDNRAAWQMEVGVSNWSRTIAAPAAPGHYEFRYFISDSSTVFRSPVIVVGPPAPAPED